MTLSLAQTAIGVGFGVVVLTFPTSGSAQRADGRAAIEAVKSGGTVMLCRHAITARMQETEPVDYADSTTQRLLSSRGERQSEQIGDAWETLGIQIATVVASPMHRARRTAELMFDRQIVIDSVWHTNGSDYSGAPAEGRARTLRSPIQNGNTVVISHIGTMRNALGESPGEVEEGDCVIVRPGGDSFEVLGVVPWRVWIREAGRV